MTERDIFVMPEIHSALKMVQMNYFERSYDDISNLFQEIFPGYKKVKRFSNDSAKCGYSIKHGLVPFSLNSIEGNV